MSDTEKAVASPEDLGVRTTIEDVLVSIPALIEAATLSGVAIEGRRFIDCILVGPSVLIPTAETRFGNCNFGDVEGDVRNLFLTAAGTRVIGALSVAGCVFERCLFHGVGLVGDEAVIAAFVATVDVPA
ncbi:MAG: hypothetical protein K2X25_09580 [Caulobacteraceae bacterium]|nr:hypothetical protein [Caulobacteraceae bacterium]